VIKVRGQKCGQKDKWTNCGQNVQICGQNVQICGQNGGQTADKKTYRFFKQEAKKSIMKLIIPYTDLDIINIMTSFTP
jgi:hypothetical protein